MELRKPYNECKPKEYKDLKEFFSTKIVFSKNDDCELIKKKINSEETNVSRVWLLFAMNDGKWKCLQVAQSKNEVKKEINDVIDFLFRNFNQKSKGISYTNSAFYENVCPKATDEGYRELLYSKIGNEYEHFQICFLNVDMYLGIESDNDINKTDMERIIEICKNQYAEAKIAYQTLAVYWRLVSSGIDGQTIAYIAGHTSEFK